MVEFRSPVSLRGSFGPPSLLMIHRFNRMVDSLLPLHAERLYFTSSTPTLLPNAILFISTFRMVRLRLSPEVALAPFGHLLPSFGSYGNVPRSLSHDLSVLTGLQSILRAIRLDWYNPANFDAAHWAKSEASPSGNMNWVIPGKILAFSTPYDSNGVNTSRQVATPLELVPVFRVLGITSIVRLCEPLYDSSVFECSGFRFYEMVFPDGSTPPTPIREEFLTICDSSAVIAVHCQAGRGRTYF
jgi:cell division cycle 14